ncbi:uncharacterized protein BDR25DRAFT_318645 [Lindgomyces ingoldianus]|uniref:Uncharacterized protein n=1 Tax=Lindgomyces ingoldianus TaxID=673940 RepID=A0ACB6QG93_9PLEO|nr:uncharacterized protein BDR25DRAFT_318645 [Lindgomyces ingoldianus]KAF2465156.1 hypothetical protein BDR25DRAFT_318645 [Lindgomyces ingoldianus]
MPLALGIPTDDEFQVFVPMMFEAMGGRSEFVNAVWPDGHTKEGQEMSVQRFLFLKQIDPSTRWSKVTDTDTGEILGVAQWNVYEDAKPQEMIVDGPPGTWKNDDEKEFAQEIFKSFMEERWKFIRENDLPIIALNIMTVAPKHQYQGVGTLLQKWGTDLADKIGATCIVEATVEGRWLYEKGGFVVQRHHLLEVPQKFQGRQQQRIFFMTRPRRS